ncbi:MAG: carbohydrate ABC transporter permease [Lachnospiraceae bacterium]|jgi:multiple sugar transport system permease protein|nr:carbohydrate ABC transporter permease [Lachnospiraceae bacterium]
MRKIVQTRIQWIILFGACLLIWLPLLLMAAAVFMPEDELLWRYLSPLGIGRAPVRAALIPSYPSWEALMELLFHSPGFFVMFWNSCIQVIPMLLGQLLVGAPAAWAFAQFSFPGRRLIFCLYVLLIVLPFQVTQVSNYLVLDKLGLLDSHWAMILPGIWSAFPVFIMTRSFQAIPKSLLEAAYLDGAGKVETFFLVGIPVGYPGIVTALLLGFMDGWNALEQPMAYLRDISLWPLALYLPDIVQDKAAVAFAAGAVMMVPPVLLYLNGQGELEEGMGGYEGKE